MTKPYTQNGFITSTVTNAPLPRTEVGQGVLLKSKTQQKSSQADSFMVTARPTKSLRDLSQNAFRPDDIVIASWAKSGTTLTQQIVGQLIFQGKVEVDIARLSPWIDLRIPPREEVLTALEAQTHRRFVKSHLPVDALRTSPKAKYIFVARDGRDAVWSLHNHHSQANEIWYKALNETPGLVGPPIPRPNPDVVAYFLHYADIIRDKKVVMQQIATFLEIKVDDDKWDDMVEHCSMDYMRKHGQKGVPGGVFWNDGTKSFLFQGVNGRWKDMLTVEDCEKYEKVSREKLGEDCAYWLANGGALS